MEMAVSPMESPMSTRRRKPEAMALWMGDDGNSKSAPKEHAEIMNVASSAASMKYSRQCASSDWRAPRLRGISNCIASASSMFIVVYPRLFMASAHGMRPVARGDAHKHFSFAERQSTLICTLRETFVQLPHLTASERISAGTEPARCLVQES